VLEGFLWPRPRKPVCSDEVTKALEPGLGQVIVYSLTGCPTRSGNLVVTEVCLGEKHFCGAQRTFEALKGTPCFHRIPAFPTAKSGF
tara:strand:+ start:955 stop:1215 length:261 start_codon:yes stop_codon:yes gene_type:complete